MKKPTPPKQRYWDKDKSPRAHMGKKQWKELYRKDHHEDINSSQANNSVESKANFEKGYDQIDWSK